MNSPLRIVYLEDDPADVRLVRDTLDDEGLRTELLAVDNRADFLAAIQQDPDLILADYALPAFDGMEALRLCRGQCPDRPFIFVTGAVGEERAIETIKSGATDYVLKTHLSRLTVAVRRAVAEAAEIAERKRVVEQLNVAKAAAESASQAKSQFLANISHELRTPMNAILGMIDIALSKASDKFVQDCLETAKGSADLLLSLLNDLLDTAKIESGKLELESAPFSLRGMLDQMTRVLFIRASEKGLSFHCRVPEGTPDILLGDRLRLQQVLFNLAGNAIKFTERGEVEVAVRCLAQDQVACLEFAVRDTGIGIPPSSLEHLFQPFAQGDASMARRYGGSGLGLSICKSLVEMMGGQMRVESEPSQGTIISFTVCLPVASELLADGNVPALVSQSAGAPLRILLVEDNPANQKFANYVLQDRGHSVETAGDGAEAIRLAAQQHFDVILMDVQMPKMNGLDASLAIRQRENGRRRVPIVAMTAHAMRSDRDRCMAAGMDGYLCKPVKREELIEAVERLGRRTMDESGRMKVDPSLSRPIPDPSSFTSGSAPFNLEEAVARLDGQFEIFKEMAEFFLNDGIQLLLEIQAAAASGDTSVIGLKAHRLKGTLLYLSAKPATDAADLVESVCRSGDLAQTSSAIRRLEEEVTRLAAALREYGPHNCDGAAPDAAEGLLHEELTKRQELPAST
jgi:two-component system, sensor histidine kinase and response regulator